jgi:hypothetical protein
MNLLYRRAPTHKGIPAPGHVRPASGGQQPHGATATGGGSVGPNGAGKTTAMRIILGVLEPDAGEMRWRGRPVNNEIRKRIGYLPEDHGQTSSR